MACSCSSGCDNNVKLLYSSSGIANTGYLADQVYRKLMKDGVGSGTCLSAIGANISGFIVSANEADENIIIDGCPVSCGKKIFEKNGLPFTHFITTDFNVKKSETEITSEVIIRVTSEIKNQIG